MKIKLKNREELIQIHAYKEYSSLTPTELAELSASIYMNGDYELDDSKDMETNMREIIVESLAKDLEVFNDNELLEYFSMHDKELLSKAEISEVNRKKFLGIF